MNRADAPTSPGTRRVSRLPVLVRGAVVAASAAFWFALVFRQFFDPTRSIATFPDATDMIIPLFHNASACFGRGEYPYWMETVMGGLPLYDSPMFSAEYPLYLLRLPLFGDPVAGMIAVHWLSVLHLAVLAVNAYVLMRCLRLACLPAALGAALLAGSPNSIAYAEWVNIIAPYSWFPLVIAGLVKCLSARRGGAGIVMGGVALGLLCLASPAQALLHTVVVSAVFVVHGAWRRFRRGDAAGVAPMLVRASALFVLGFVIGAPALVPAVRSAHETIRFNSDFPPVIGGGAIPFKQALHGQLELADLAGALLPLQVPHLTGNPFIGLGAACFAMLGLARWRQARFVVPLALIASYGLLSATGEHLGFAALNHALPFLDKFRQPPRHLFLFVFGSSALAGSGLQYLLSARRLLKPGALLLGAGFVLLATLALRAPREWLAPGSEMVTIGLALLGILLALLARQRGRRLAVVGVLAIVAANAGYPTHVPSLDDGDLFAATHQRIHGILPDLVELPDAAASRFVFLDGDETQFWSMSGSYYGIRSFQAYMNPLPYRQWDEVFQRFHLRHYYPMLGARYLLCSVCELPVVQDYQPLRTIDGYSLYESREAQPLYSVAGQVSGTYRDAEEFYSLIDERGPGAGGVFVDVSEPDAGSLSEWLAGGGRISASVTQTRRSSNHREVVVDSDRRGLLVLNEYARPEWRAFRGDVPVTIHKVNLNQVGVLIGAGRSEIRFEYRPTLFILLLWLERATLLVLGLALVARGRRAGR
jgi:hypothetical protein